MNDPSPATPPAPVRPSLAAVANTAYRVGVIVLLAVIAWPRLQPLVSNLPATAQTGFRLGPSRNAPQQQAPAAPAPSYLMQTYGFPAYDDAYPSPGDMLPRNLGGIPVVYVVNLPYLDNGRRDTVKATLQDVSPIAALQIKP
jgi:hypothetical protein